MPALHYAPAHRRTTALHKRGPPDQRPTGGHQRGQTETCPQVSRLTHLTSPSRLASFSFSCLVMHPHPCSKIPICIIPTPYLKSRPFLVLHQQSQCNACLACSPAPAPAPPQSINSSAQTQLPRPRSCTRMNRNGDSRTAYARPIARVVEAGRQARSLCAPTSPQPARPRRPPPFPPVLHIPYVNPPSSLQPSVPRPPATKPQPGKLAPHPAAARRGARRSVRRPRARLRSKLLRPWPSGRVAGSIRAGFGWVVAFAWGSYGLRGRAG